MQPIIPTEEEKKFDKIYNQMANTATDLSNKLNQVNELVKKLPNDQELGEEIRKLMTKEKDTE